MASGRLCIRTGMLGLGECIAVHTVRALVLTKSGIDIRMLLVVLGQL